MSIELENVVADRITITFTVTEGATSVEISNVMIKACEQIGTVKISIDIINN